MTEYKMTDEWRKKLTEFLGECWHVPKVDMEPLAWVGGQGTHCFTCKICGNNYPVTWNSRTFTIDKDMLAVFRKIRDKGKWKEFFHLCYISYCKGAFTEHFTAWLFLDNHERACCLAAMFLEEQG